MNKTHITINTRKRWAWLTMLLIGILTVGTVSCDEDDSDDNNTVTPEPEEIASAYMTVYGVDGPSGRVRYINISENVPENLDVSNSIELGLNTFAFGIGDRPFSWNVNAQTFTKYSVDRTDLSISAVGIVSLASVGFNNPFPNPAVVSDSIAYLFDLTEGVAIEWDYENMEVKEVLNIEPWTDHISGDEFAVTVPKVIGNKVLMSIREYPLSTCCNIGNMNGIGATIAVFDVASKTLQYNSDNRSIAAFNTVRVDNDGSLYITPTRENAFLEPYYNYTGPSSPHVILRLNQDGTFDPTFSLDLASVIPDLEKIEIMPAVLDGKAIVQYYSSNDVSLDTVAFDDRYGIPRAFGTKSVAVDLTTGDVMEFTAWADYDYAEFLPETRGELYVVAYSMEVNPFDRSHYLRVNSFDNYTELSTYSVAAGGLFKLWGD
ncbi:MAG: hypothetical protein ACFB15_31275 [Cyclobacteriaceae bacterium]